MQELPGAFANIKMEHFRTSPYSPDLAPSDFALFPAPNGALSGQHFSSDAEAELFTRNFFFKLNGPAYSTGIQKLVYWYDKCLNH